MKRIITHLVLLVSVFAITDIALAQGQKQKAEKSKTAGDRVDISDLENKYWAPKDTDFSVVQNRTYTKEKRFSLSLGTGILINDPYNEATMFDVTGNYYLNERYGVELSFQKADIQEGEVVSNLAQFSDGGSRPNFSQIDTMYEVGFNYVPFYAKVSVLGKRIIYFDMMITPIVGLVNYDIQLEEGPNSKSAFSYGFNISQHFFLSENITVRADLKNRWFNEDRIQWEQSGRENVSLGSVFNNTTTFTVGLQYFF